MMNPNILNQNPLMFFDRAVNAQRSQLLTVMADAVSECRTAADQAAELNETEPRAQTHFLMSFEVKTTPHFEREAKIPVSYTHLDVYKRQSLP